MASRQEPLAGHRRLPRRLPSFVLAVLLTGCGYSCTSAGCMSGVTVHLPGPRTIPRPATVRLCVDAECRTATVTRGQVAMTNEIASLEPGQSVRVTLTTTRGDKTLVEASTMVELQQVAPNGERCGPICAAAGLRLEGTTLVPVD
ncbi:MAG: hypothetical protein U0R64_00405 [Candidatus Nanopelagicales bacterium]